MQIRHPSTLLFVMAGVFVSANTVASADEPNQSLRASLAPLTINADGTVTVDGTHYRDLAEYHRSEAFRAEGRRCATVQPEPSYLSYLAPADCSLLSTSILPEYEPTEDMVIEIPVVFHVVMDSAGQGDIPDALIYSQIDILNEDFRALPGTLGAPGNDATIQFTLTKVDPDGQPTTGINRYNNNQWYNDNNTMKPSLNWDTTRFLNIYTNTASGALGYATFPAQSAGSPQDGVVLAWPYVGRDAPMGDIYNQGRTATHEVGHYLGLFHTFEGGCTSPTQGYSSGDLIADTVAEDQPQFQCIEQQSACGGGPNPIHNYMDYTNDTCMDHFTPEQVNRMRCSILNYRATLMNLVPVVDFSYVHEGTRIVFTNESVDQDGTIASVAWSFGDGATSSEFSTEHTYDQTGPLVVSLTVTDDRGSEKTVTRPIYVSDDPLASFKTSRDGLVVAFEDTSSDVNGPAVSWYWDFGDGAVSSEQHPVHEYAMPGTYPVTLTIGFGDNGTAVATRDLDIDEGGCVCTVGHAGQNRPSPWPAGVLLGLMSLFVLRRRRSSARS